MFDRLRKLYRYSSAKLLRTAHPNGHFYSPVVDPDALIPSLDALYPSDPHALGIDFQENAQRALIDAALKRYMPEFDYPQHGPDDRSLSYYYVQNSQYSWLDARALFCLLRFWQPKRVVEVGSGYSSLLISDVKRRFLPDMQLQCIEPFPRPFLHRRDLGIELLEKPVQQVPIEFFESLVAGDLLFIDSSHVCKTGSDVQYLFFQVLPHLQPGVRVHIHDIFLPFEYPKEWVIDENRSWNEQYVLHALLMHSSGFKVLFGSAFAFWKFPDDIRTALNLPGGRAFGGCSIYLERQ